MSQQINLFHKDLYKPGRGWSVLNMLQGVGVILLCAILFYAYAIYQTRQVEQQLGQANKILAAEQRQLDRLTAEFSQQRSGLTLEQELKKVAGEAAAQREVINALKSGVIGNTKGYSAYMQAFARQTPNGLWLTGFSIDGDATQMSISGAALSAELVPGYIMRLNNEEVMRGKNFASLKMQRPKPETGKPEASKLAAAKYLEFNLQSVRASEADK